MRALEGVLGLCGELATAASRWWPRGCFWTRQRAWHGRGRHSAMARAVERLRGDAWAPARQKKAAGKPLHGAGVGAVGGRRRNRAGVGKKGIRAILQFPKVPGTKL